jgi:hypothetical protein
MPIIIFDNGAIQLIEEISEDCFSELETDLIDLTNPDELKMLKKAIKRNPMWADLIRI